MVEIEELKELEHIKKNIISLGEDHLISQETLNIPVGVEGVSPSVYTIDNFISAEDCQHFINISKNKIKQALVSGSKEGYVSQGRSGSNCWIKHDFDSVTKRVGNKISDLVGFPLENAEAFQVIHYGIEQEYRQHYDGWLFDGSEKSRRNMRFGGQRMVTALAYLNTVPKGGGTKFTKLETVVKSERGKLLVFSNVYEGSNKRHELSEHAGMPVIEGEKWAFNLWFREKSRKQIYDYGGDILTPLLKNQEKEKEKEKEKVVTPKVECTIDVLKDSNVKFEINYPRDSKPLNPDNQVDRNSEVLKGETLFTSSEMGTIVSLCQFEDKDRISCWVQNNKIPEIISKISKLVNIESSYFENMCVTKYKNGIKHSDHLDAYDLNSEKGQKYTKFLGQRLLTITGFLTGGNPHKLCIKFPKLNESFECETGSVLYYNNCFDNTNDRDEKYLKNYTGIPPSPDNLLQRSDGVEGNTLSPSIFNIYVREKSKTNDKVLRLDKGIPKYLNKEELDKGIKKDGVEGVKSQPEGIDCLSPSHLTIIDSIYTKSLQESLRIPNFKMVNKAPESYVMDTLQKIKEIRENKGFLSLENLDENKKYLIDEYNPVTVENVINPEIHDLVNTYFKENIQRGVYPLGDRQANRYKVLDEIMTRLLHIEFLPLIEKITGKKMAPTYTYLSAYLKGTSLPPHTDRADCEFTCSYIIGKPLDSKWNIYIHKKKQPVKHKGRYDFTPPKEECLAVDCLENGLMIFNGRDHIHFREELEHDYYNIVLLHYITKGA